MNLLKILPLNETKLKILLEIYSAGEDYLRSIEKKTGINPSLLHRVLKQLEKSGVVSKEKKGKENYYSLSKEKFLINLIEKYHLDVAKKSKEVEILLKLLLNNKNILSKCKNVYLFGSFVAGGVTKNSDLDILFLSNSRKEIIKWCREASLIVGREINPLIYTSDKFKSELRKKEPLLTSIVSKIKNRVIVK
ncbi:MAG: nucleotidyltransferase domain-containing protein [Nanoarchaeota archaeon]|nr:nucleotidyltransferase domain-containing protein [Nanoarchaeota archaeon]